MIPGIRYGYIFYSFMIVMAIAASKPADIKPSTSPGKTNLSYMQMPRNELSSLKKANAWLNSEPLAETDLKGKVVLVQFWTYTCINWIRTLPYIRAWAEKYKDKGLVIVGVHTPEFPFEKDNENVHWATQAMKIDYPVAIDNNYDIWKAFNNNYWPALYFIDAKGRIRHEKFGEGDYEQSEKMIQQLLQEKESMPITQDLVSINAQGVEAFADWKNLHSPENYLGYERTENFTARRLKYDKQFEYEFPTDLALNHWGLTGEWTVEKRSIKLNKVNGRIVYRFQARDLHLVMGPTLTGTVIRFRVLIDGRPPGQDHGSDIDELGYGTITQKRLYQLIRQSNPATSLQFEIEFYEAGAEAFAFTFG